MLYTLLKAIYTITLLNPTTTLGGSYYYLYFADEKAEVQVVDRMNPKMSVSKSLKPVNMLLYITEGALQM